MRKTILAVAVALLAGCSSTTERTEVSLSGSMSNDLFTCNGSDSECYADAERICGERGYEIVRDFDEGNVTTAGSSTGNPRLDDPFGTVRRERQENRAAQTPLRFRCKS